jgi:hypothetical protein
MVVKSIIRLVRSLNMGRQESDLLGRNRQLGKDCSASSKFKSRTILGPQHNGTIFGPFCLSLLGLFLIANLLLSFPLSCLRLSKVRSG